MTFWQLYSCLFFISCELFAQPILEYPRAPKSNHADNYFGVTVEDPYRSLENMKSPETIEWLSKEQKMFEKYKKSMAMYRGVMHGIDVLASSYGRQIWTEKGLYFYYQYTDFEGPTLYQLKSSYDQSDGVKIISSSRLKSKEGLPLKIQSVSVSEDSTFLILSCQIESSDWNEIKVFDLKRKNLLLDAVRWSKFYQPITYKSGFFYFKFDSLQKYSDSSALRNQAKLFFHRFGSKQNDDIFIKTQSEQNQILNFSISADSRWAVVDQIQKMDSTYFRVLSTIPLDSIAWNTHTVSFEEKAKPFIIRPQNSTDKIEIIEIQNHRIFAFTDLKAPMGRIVEYDSRAVNKYSSIISSRKETMVSASYVWGKFLCQYFKEGKNQLIVYGIDGKELSYYSSEIGEYTRGFGDVGPNQTTFFSVQSLFYPPITFELNLKTMQLKNVTASRQYSVAESYEFIQVQYPSHDGVMVPMYLVYKKSLNVQKEKHPVLLNSYGGFGVNVKMDYDPAKVLFLEIGGILAFPCIRGGGELGKEWHDAGRKKNKPTSFSDFIAAAEFLIKSNYTDSSKIAITGASNGGLLTSACMLKRPYLFKAVISEVGVYDMLRFPKFTAGPFWKDEYGDPSDSSDFKVINSYSPYHTIKPVVNYPATLIVASENDDRVVPLHSFKYLARLQALSLNKNPHVLLFQSNAGHNGPETYTSYLESEAMKLSFIFQNLGMDPLPYIRNILDFRY